MSFLDIKNPSERDAIVKEYLAIIKRIQQKNLNEKAHDLVRSEDIERTLEPVVRTTKQSTEAITKELLPIKNEIKVLNERLENRENKLQKGKEKEKEKEGEKEEEEPAQDDDVVQMFYNRVSEEKLDKYFGIVMENGRYKMGNKYVHLDGIDLIVDHKRYVGTKGFWSLIMVARPENYTREDFVKYRDLIAHTNAMAYPNNVTTSSRLKSTKKWRSIFPLFDHLDDDESPSEDRNRESLEREKETSPRSYGDSIQFLPASIKGMETKLNYLLGEYRAGNTSSTRNEIVSILDELLRRKGISRKEYKDINNFLQ